MPALTFEDATMRARADEIGFRNGLTPGVVNLKGPKVQAYVNHGRWVADCVTEGCSGARDINPDYPMWCVYCGATWVVEWPAKKTLVEITEILEQRPVRANQNYDPLDHLRLHPTGSAIHEPCPDPIVWLAYENNVRGIPIGNELVRKRYERWVAADWRKRGLAKEMAEFNVDAK